MYSIGEISKMFQLPISTLRYYDKEGLFPHLKRVNGVRQFSESEIETLRVIDCLKKSGLEIKDIKEYMALCSLGNTTLKQRKEIFEKQKEEVLQEMEKLQKVLSMLNYKCRYYDQAIEKNDEAYVQALSFNQFPPQIQQYYKHSHEDC
ncbi:MerR family transcriptional regulator [Faecalibacillus sp. MSK20_93]|uniref:MerR family transcriptional regulator n=1 Tax=Faecalibacillus sp. MSK20_93 TaxID=2884903 RepID=UPI001D0A6990|nr:MerR family transcriptional regulator [Faecalibacillus sp. MSK20_93]MCB7510277.1 MerR family transcriptional regulator [bacterium MSK20_81]MCB8549907.1 MerR family transcriptional regulator [Faecalibacillus sp. MSK20_93]